MQRNIKRMATVVMALVCVLLLICPVVSAKVFVTIDLIGLKNVHIRADIYENNSQGDHGPKHGRIQILIREDLPAYYSYKFMLDLRKASKNTEYNLKIWTDLPNINITIYGDGSKIWDVFEGFAIQVGIDKYGANDKIETSTELLGLKGYNVTDTGMVIATDDRGTYKNIKAGAIYEMDAIEWLIDFMSPILKDQLILRYPEHTDLIEWFFSKDKDFEDFCIEHILIEGGVYPIGMGVLFECNKDSYRTDDINFTQIMGDFDWYPPL